MDYVKEQTSKIKTKDFNKVTEGASKIIDMVRNNRALMNLIDDVKTLLALVKDYLKGNYKDVPYKTMAAVVFALIYLLNPFDLVPDFIPGLGYIDDAAVIMFVVKYVSDDIAKYRRWKNHVLLY